MNQSIKKGNAQKLGLKILIPSVFVFTIIILAIGVYSYFAESNLILDDVNTKANKSIEESIIRIQNTDETADSIKKSLKSNFLRQARLVALLIEQDPQLLSLEGITELTEKVGVDEIHVADGDGILRYSNIPEFMGFDFNSSEQSKEFMQLIDNPEKEIAQDPQLRGADEKLFQYVGVARQDQPGFVQVGMSPEALQELLDKNGINQIVDEIKPTANGYIFFTDPNGVILGHADDSMIGSDISDSQWGSTIISQNEGNITFDEEGKEKYAVFQKYGDYVIVSVIPTSEFKAPLNALKISLAIAILIGIIFGTLIIYFLIKKIITKPLNQVVKHINTMADGDFTYKANQTYMDRQDEIGSLAQSVDIMQTFIKEQADIAEEVAKGNLGLNIEPKSEKDVLSQSMQKVIKSLNMLVEETKILNKAAAEGMLSTRGNAEQFQGGYKETISGINQTLDIVMGTFGEANQVLGKMAVNDLTMPMSEDHKGDFKEFADSINSVRLGISAIEDVFVKCSQGDISLLEEYRETGKKSDNDKLIPASIKMMETIQDLINESNMLAESAVNGDLTVRGNSDKFEGGYKEIIVGLNKMMDAIVNPVQEILVILEGLAKKDLMIRMDGDYKGDYSKIKEAMNITIQSLNEVLSEINYAAKQVEIGSEQVAGSSQTLSQGASEQASSVEEIGGTVTEVAQQIKENADNANKANELSVKSKRDAQQGNDQMQEMLNAMDEINESSKNISNIIKVIDEIAFQTNILALNAAVEAARAGEHGKGFAVVAEEVRNLAARSAQAAKETTDLIDNSINKVEDGYKIANDTAEALQKIVEGVSDAESIVSTIAEASTQQAAAISEINTGIEQISDITQSNTATAEESASTSEKMADQAQRLKEMIGEFKLNQSEAIDTEDIKQLEKAEEQPKIDISFDDDSFGKY